MAVLNFLNGEMQAFDDSGDPLVGGKVYFYANRSAEFKDTYTDSKLVYKNTNPVTLNANGRATVWLSGIYRVRMEDAAGTLIYSEDDINTTSSSSLSGGALVSFLFDINVASSTPTAIPFGIEYYDTNAIHESTNNTRLTVPAGVSRVRLSANIEWLDVNTTGIRQISVTKGGAAYGGNTIDSKEAQGNLGQGGLNTMGPIIEVTGGNYFEVVFLQTSGVAVTVNSGSTFSMEIVK